LLQEGTDIKYGARHLKRAIEKFMVYPLANLLASEQIQFCDMILVDWDEEEQGLSFEREGQGVPIPAPTRRRVKAAPLRNAAGAGGEERIKVNARDFEPVLTRG
jgi:hypothetical protein